MPDEKTDTLPDEKAPGTAVERAAIEKPLNQTQLRNLEKITTGDFDELESRLRRELEKRYADRIRAVNDKYGDDSTLRAARDGCSRLVGEMQNRAQEFMNTLADQNIGVKGGGYSAFSISCTPTNLELKGHAEALARVKQAHDRLLRLAIERLSSHRRAAQRQILLSGVTGMAASKVLDEMPGTRTFSVRSSERWSKTPAPTWRSYRPGSTTSRSLSMTSRWTSDAALARVGGDPREPGDARRMPPLEVVVGLHRQAPNGRRPDMGGHYRDPSNPDKTLCGLPVVDRKTTKRICCTPCWVKGSRLAAPAPA